MRRLRTIALLILALVTAPLAPVHAGWSCPDGTPCVAVPHHGFACAGERSTVHSCCKTAAVTECLHGALPGMDGPHRGAGVSAPPHCRFKVTGRTSATAATATVLRHPNPVPAVPSRLALTAPQTSLAAPSYEATGYQPPPLLASGPARAPPLA